MGVNGKTSFMRPYQMSDPLQISAEAYLHGGRQVLGVVVTIATENWNFFLATLDAVNTSMHVGLLSITSMHMTTLQM